MLTVGEWLNASFGEQVALFTGTELLNTSMTASTQLHQVLWHMCVLGVVVAPNGLDVMNVGSLP